MYSALPKRDCEGQPSAVHAALPLRLRKRSIGCSEVYGNDKVSITHNPEVVRVRTTLGFKLDGGGPCRATSGPRTFVNESVAYCWCDLIPLRRRSIASSYSLRRRVLYCYYPCGCVLRSLPKTCFRTGDITRRQDSRRSLFAGLVLFLHSLSHPQPCA